ncbi:MAG: single-stranded-DNA-specific exonuclease RecJ [Clostridium sp.]|nr:single-stranded-DNA-specific exonuclease RecJ [Clostridium sp.]
MRYKQWTVAPAGMERRVALERAGIPSLVAAVLAARGMGDLDEVRRLLTPPPDILDDPMLLQDMDRAVIRVRQAIERGETVAVYGDYDVDGITATCLLTDFLVRKGARVVPYIPSRLDEGYGLNREAVQLLAEQGVTLIITVDCGITAGDETVLAKSLGIDVVITDHHECKDALPRAVAVVDPRRRDCSSPFKDQAGVGVALKLAMAVEGPAGAGRILEEYADLVAIGTIADVMPMMGENRTVVRMGLKALSRPRRVGLAMLMREAGLEERNLTSVSIGYTLAPRINASGRMGQAMLAVELLLTKDPERAVHLARELCELNRERQAIESEIFQSCVSRLSRAPQETAVVLADPAWHQGVVGIVASRLSEKYGCPCFMICLDQGMGKGSCRSYGGLNLFDALSQCAPLLEGFGGHALAAGFTVREENIPALAQGLREAVTQQLGDEEPISQLDVDVCVHPSQLTVDAVAALDLLEPCGTGNPRPVFLLTGALIQTMAQVGRGRHLKMRLEAKGVPIDAIFFSANGAQMGVSPGGRVDLAFYPQINEFRGSRTVQLQIIDLRPALTRAQQERGAYEKYRRGEALSWEEVHALLPSRADFVGLWRWLEKQAALTPVIKDTPARIARGVSRVSGQPEVPVRTLLCLEIMEERGLITMTGQEQLSITLHRLEYKVDLEDSPILRRLREGAGEPY